MELTDTVNELKNAGFPDALFDRLDTVAKELRVEMRSEFQRIETRLAADIAEASARSELMQANTRADLMPAQNALLVKMAGIFLGVISVAVAIIKLLPNLS